MIALQFQDQNDFDNSLKFFEKCLDASKRAEKKEQEAECYQKIGRIYEKLDPPDLDKAIEYLDKFLALCQESSDMKPQ